MGFGRSGSALVEAVERGIKFGIKTGEIVKNADKTYSKKAAAGKDEKE